MSHSFQTQRIADRHEITPELIWSKYSVLQHLIFWLMALGAWYGLHWLGSNTERFTLPVWRYVARVRFYFYTGDFQQMALLGALFGLVILGLILLVDVLIAKMSNQPPAHQILRNYYLLPRTNTQGFVALIVGINAGVFEEIFFRGGIFTLLFFLTNSVVTSIVITSAVFALLHAPMQGWLSTVWIFIIGILLNIIVLETGNYYAAMFCHITVNIGNLFLVPALFEEELEELLLQDMGFQTTPTEHP